MHEPTDLFYKANQQLKKEQAVAIEIQNKLDSLSVDLKNYDFKKKQLEQHLNRIKNIIVTAKEQEDIPKSDQLKFNSYLAVAAEDGAATVKNLNVLNTHIDNLKQAFTVLTEKKYKIEGDLISVQVKLDSLKLRKDLSLFEITNNEAEELRRYLELDSLEVAVQELEAEAFAVKTVVDSEESIRSPINKDVNVKSFIQDVLEGKI